ncbi:hypothetical protein SESBI_37595 [Sesbania bispinosa]|nr:hypothetical protein SESBI_37595 [Sesbania bispinosa]
MGVEAHIVLGKPCHNDRKVEHDRNKNNILIKLKGRRITLAPMEERELNELLKI